MAVVSQKYTIECYIEDAKGQNSNISVYIGQESGELDNSELADAAIALYGYIQPLVGGQIRRASAKINLIDKIPGTPTAGSDIRYGATFVLATNVGTIRRFILRFPTFDQTLTANTSTVRVNFNNANVLALWNAFRLGIVVSGLNWKLCNDNGDAPITTNIAQGALDFQLNASRRRR